MKNDAMKKIHDILDEMRAAEDEILGRAEAVADEFCESFSYGEYGSGRTYFPKGTDADSIPWDLKTKLILKMENLLLAFGFLRVRCANG